MNRPTIKLGSSGPDVRLWRTLLGGAGFPVPSGDSFDAVTDQYTRVWQEQKHLAVDGVVGPASWAAMTGESPPVSSSDSEKHKAGRAVLLHVWREVTGWDPSLAELQIAGANAHLESAYGLSSYTNRETGEKSGPINNWGAVQGSSGFLATDTHADGTPYQHFYKVYATPEDGAKDFLHEMVVRRPTSWRQAQAGDIDAWAEGARSRDPESGAYGYFEQAASSRAAGVFTRAQAIAQANGEPLAVQRGGPAPNPNPPAGSSSPSAKKSVGFAAVFAAIFAAAYWYLRRGR